MKVSQKTLEIGLLIVIVLIIFGAYRFGYQSYIEKADKVKAQSRQVEERINVLTDKIAQKPVYEAGIANSQRLISGVFLKYGPRTTSEKNIMTIVDLCKKTGCVISTVNFSDPTPVYSCPDPQLTFYKSTMSFSVSAGYTAFKKVMDYINNNPERMNVETMSMTYNYESGLVTTSMVLNIYGVADSNHVYVAPVLDDIPVGTNNVFMNIIAPAEETEEGAEGAEGADAAVTE
ncbi:MAG: hypothetical protein MJ131_04070 [Lachnospiraceae bacterium]|nr:hypothetical protein [Lachnospiraceae bacterium]